MHNEEEERSPDYLLTNGDVVLCDYRDSELPGQLVTKHSGSTTVLTRGHDTHDKYKDAASHVRTLVNLSEIRDQTADVCFLDHSALKTLVARFPKHARYVLARIGFRPSWLVAFPGLIRRIYRKEIRLRGLRRFGTRRAPGLWLVMENKVQPEQTPTATRLSAEVGVAGFLDFLRSEKVDYVVTRFFRKLPELHRKGGDLDVLVADEDLRRVRAFLEAHPGTIPVGVHGVSSLYNNQAKITYYPPPIAQGILERAVDGPAGWRVPALPDAFLALAYHALYHKGFDAGIPCRTPGREKPVSVENDYVGELAAMATELGTDVPVTMEDLDAHLGSVGWRPGIDTLTKIALANEWVRNYLVPDQESEEIGLNVLIIKKRALEKHTLDAIARVLRQEGFEVVCEKVFSPDGAANAAGRLRGGDWKTASDGTDAFLPAAALAILDPSIAETRKLGVRVHTSLDLSIRAVKNKLRKAFPDPAGNLFHSTDNTAQSWEYIGICFPDERERIREEVESRITAFAARPFSERVRLRTRAGLRYVKIRLRNTLFAWTTR